MLTCQEIANELRVPEPTVRNWTNAGRLVGPRGYERRMVLKRTWTGVLDFVAELYPDDVLRNCPDHIVQAAMRRQAIRTAAKTAKIPPALRVSQ